MSHHLPPGQPVKELNFGGKAFSIDDIANLCEPVIVRGLVAHWPAVRAAKSSRGDLLAYLSKFDNGTIVPVSAGPATLGGRLFYKDDFSGMNVDRGNARFGEVLRQVYEHGATKPSPLIYMASIDVDEHLPGFRRENDVDFGTFKPLPSIWIGTRTRVAAHNDLPLNLACVVAGKRIFTLFPPDQTPNLYVGPFELTPAGRPISMVDFAAPDLDRFPRFADAMAEARIAELDAGDALFIPSMWWHHVDAIGEFNVLVNFWWRNVPAYFGTPQDALTHAMLTLRGLPSAERKIWRDIFDHYVFGDGTKCTDHIPEHVRGILAPITEDSARRIRAFLLNRLNR